MDFSSLRPPPQGWRGAVVGVVLATLFLGILATIDMLQSNASMGAAAAYFTIGALITALVGAALVFLWLAMSPLPPLYKWALACFAFVAYYFFIPANSHAGVALVALWTLLSFSLFFGALWILGARLFSRNTTGLFKPLVCLVLGSLGIGSLAWWLLASDPTFRPPSAVKGAKAVIPIPMPDPATPGPLQVTFLSYGHGDNFEVPSTTVNGHGFIHGWSGVSGWLRTETLGFNSSSLPLNGLVWLPQGEGPFPLVLIVHGRHTMETPSEQGYAYLGELFASRGFLTVSIDQNFLNSNWTEEFGDINELAARGWLILEHLSQWRNWNQSEGHRFFNKVDMDKIALLGHSRGGEAIVTAALFNKLERYPDNGIISFDYNFNIKALGAIAPVDSQYMPAGRRKSLENIDYFSLHGSHDGDVREFGGAAQYRRISFSGQEYHFKAALYIFGANHGQFNTLWNRRDQGLPTSLLFNLDQIMPPEQQQQIAKVYLSAFLEASLNGNKAYLPLFHSYWAGEKWLPQTLYLNEFADSRQKNISVDIDGANITASTFKGATISAEDLDSWQLDKINLRDDTPLGVGTIISWSKGVKAASYTIDLPEDKLKTTGESILVLSLADSSGENGDDDASDDEPIDFNIQLTDTHGQHATLPLSHNAPLLPAIDVHMMKADWLDPLSAKDNVFQTFEFPLADFKSQNPDFDPAALKSVRLIFDKSPFGHIIIDNIAIREKDEG